MRRASAVWEKMGEPMGEPKWENQNGRTNARTKGLGQSTKIILNCIPTATLTAFAVWGINDPNMRPQTVKNK